MLPITVHIGHFAHILFLNPIDRTLAPIIMLHPFKNGPLERTLRLYILQDISLKGKSLCGD